MPVLSKYKFETFAIFAASGKMGSLLPYAASPHPTNDPDLANINGPNRNTIYHVRRRIQVSRHLERFVPSLGLVLKRPHEYPSGEAEYEVEKTRIRALQQEAVRLSPLNQYILDALRKAKPVFGNPPSRVTYWVLSRAPKPAPYFHPEPPYLYADVDFKPEDLYDLGRDKKEVGERCISLVEEALSKLQTVPDFPVDVILEGCEAFRKNDYTRCWKFYRTTFLDTKIKCEIDIETSGVGTKRIFTMSYWGKILIRKQISEIDRPDFSSEKLKDDIVLEGHKLLIKPKLWLWEVEARVDNPQSYYSDAKIDLNEYPGVLELINKQRKKASRLKQAD